jgi:hydrogenase maturation protease
MKILIYGYGNPGRQDDGLGTLFVEELEKWAKSENLDITCDSNYQLNAEDALTVSENGLVIFADASKHAASGYNFRQIKPGGSISFSTHSLNPESVLALCKELYSKEPAAYLMTIEGYGWEVNAQLTAKARQNLDKALGFIRKFIKEHTA